MAPDQDKNTAPEDDVMRVPLPEGHHSIEEMWTTYAKMARITPASIIYEKVRATFYTGAAAMFAHFYSNITAKDVDAEKAWAEVEAWHEEVEVYAARQMIEQIKKTSGGMN